jgi:hypothetical protein
VDKVEQENREKQLAARELKQMQYELERLIVRLTGVQAMNEASYLRKAVAEIKRASRTL